MSAPNPKLHMRDYLAALDEFGVTASVVLCDRGVHPAVVEAKAQIATRKGYADYGVSPMGSWITDLGRKALSRMNEEVKDAP